jgi:meso-butanediol dehydrogenase / (S,S)-butanediol dehydrogenase / diacetyl reductase
VSFHGKVALITGAGSGIGEATALAYAERGGTAVVVDIQADQAARVADDIARRGGISYAITADLSRPAEVESMVGQAVGKFGRIDFLHNNAFGLPSSLQEKRVASIEHTDDRVWEHTIAIGLTAVLKATQAVLPIMLRQGSGAIVNTSSVAAFFGDYGSVSYNTVKAGVINLTRVTAVEYAARGIRANCICPGAVNTPLLQRGIRDRSIDTAAAIRAHIPLGRAGDAREVAEAALFLASDAASFITGTVLIVDGGFSAAGGLAAYGRS